MVYEDFAAFFRAEYRRLLSLGFVLTRNRALAEDHAESVPEHLDDQQRLIQLENRCAPHGSQGVRILPPPFVRNVHNVQHGPSGGDPADKWPLAKIRNCESFFATLEANYYPVRPCSVVIRWRGAE